jgi:HSP20 family protein
MERSGDFMPAGTSAIQQPVQEQPAPGTLGVNGLLDRISQIREAVARRAYELFLSRGSKAGLEQHDWFCAEEQLLHVAHLVMYETNEALTVMVEVPGFRPEDLAVSLEPRSVSVAGQRALPDAASGRSIIYAEHCSNRLLRTISLPVDVEPKRSSATLRNGILELVMPKSISSDSRRQSIQAYSIVRSKDYRRWTYAVAQLFQRYS